MADKVARVWNGSSWEQISAPVSVPNAVAYYQSTAPTGVPTGTIWVDSDDSSTYVYNGSSWVSVGSGGTVNSLGFEGTIMLGGM